MTIDEYVKKANKVHNNKYDYSHLISNVELSDEIDVVCFTHGKFKQIASLHLDGTGCKKCYMRTVEKKN